MDISGNQKYGIKINFGLFAFSIFAPLLGATGEYLVQASTNSGFYPVSFVIGAVLVVMYAVDIILLKYRVGHKAAFTPIFFSLLFVVFIGPWLFTGAYFPKLDVLTTLLLVLGAPAIIVYYERISDLYSKE
jgi:hypothetical protein